MTAPRIQLLTIVVAFAALAAAAASAGDLPRLRIVAVVPLGGRAGGAAAFDGTSILAPVAANGAQLVRIDPRTNQIVRRLRLDRPLDLEHFDYRVSTGFGSIWVTENGNYQALLRIDPAMRAVEKRFPVDQPMGALAAFGSVWAPLFFTYEVARIDPRTERVVRTFPAAGPTAAVAGAGSVWVLAHRASLVLRVDPRSGRVVARIPLHLSQPGGPERMTFGFGSAWVTADAAPPARGGVIRIDPATNRQTTEIELPSPTSGAFYPTVGGGSVWVGTDNGYVVRIDPRTNSVTGVVYANAKSRGCNGLYVDPESCGVHGLTFGAGTLWAVVPERNALVRIAP
jgi:streptogramin lyase